MTFGAVVQRVASCPTVYDPPFPFRRCSRADKLKPRATVHRQPRVSLKFELASSPPLSVTSLSDLFFPFSAHCSSDVRHTAFRRLTVARIRSLLVTSQTHAVMPAPASTAAGSISSFFCVALFSSLLCNLARSLFFASASPHEKNTRVPVPCSRMASGAESLSFLSWRAGDLSEAATLPLGLVVCHSIQPAGYENRGVTPRFALPNRNSKCGIVVSQARTRAQLSGSVLDSRAAPPGHRPPSRQSHPKAVTQKNFKSSDRPAFHNQLKEPFWSLSASESTINQKPMQRRPANPRRPFRRAHDQVPSICRASLYGRERVATLYPELALSGSRSHRRGARGAIPSC